MNNRRKKSFFFFYYNAHSLELYRGQHPNKKNIWIKCLMENKASIRNFSQALQYN